MNYDTHSKDIEESLIRNTTQVSTLVMSINTRSNLPPLNKQNFGVP
jgi:hypothetical protein